MKLFTISLILMGFAFVSCNQANEEEEPIPTPNPNPVNTVNFTASVNGQTWNASYKYAYIDNENNLTLFGKSSDGRCITVSIKNVSTGTFQINLANCLNYTAAYQPDTTSSLIYSNNNSSSSGSFTISSINNNDSTITGTFSFTLGNSKSSVNITNGVFSNIRFTKQLPPTNNNEMSVKIDNVLFTPVTINGMINMNNLMISGLTGTKSVGIIIPSNVLPGTYSLSNFGTYRCTYSPSSAASFLSESGSITIVSHNTTSKTISGTFNFLAKQYQGTTTYNMTDGSFSITY